MNEPIETAGSPATTDPLADFDSRLTALRSAGVHRFDPVRLHYAQALAKRAARHEGSARRLLEARLAQALAALQERFDLALAEARETASRSAQCHPEAADRLEQLLAAGDLRGLRRLTASLKSDDSGTSLGALVRQLDQHAQDNADARPQASAGPRPELKTLRDSRNTWSRLSVDRQVAQALEQVPKNAGPINSHMLVLRSLALMRDISPDYLNRFISYADTLLSLEQGEQEKVDKPDKADKPKKRQASKTTKK